MDYYDRMRREEGRESNAAIRVGVKPGPDAEQARWTRRLTIFMRFVCLLWIFQGLAQWARIISPAEGSFLDLSGASMAATVFFAVLDLVAAVGLWLVAPWGGVVWLLTLFAQIFVASIRPHFFFGGVALNIAGGLLLAAYLFLSWRANVAAGQSSFVDRLIGWAKLSERFAVKRPPQREG